ncbi:MAG: DUF805 domain-containing protein [Rhodobacteraceae bacterium]|nr:DUF805 domain-containing protein [Paracoccaceae bacterium]
MKPSQAVASAFRNSLQFSGRSRRPDYWWFFVFVFGGAFLLGLIELALGRATGGWLVRGFQIIIFVPFLAVGWRRLQDTGRPGWWLLVPSAIVIISTFVSGSVLRMLAGIVIPGFAPSVGMTAGQGLVAVLSLVQVMAGLVLVWWMSRPSQHGPNAYGPEPRVH